MNPEASCQTAHHAQYERMRGHKHMGRDALLLALSISIWTALIGWPLANYMGWL